MAKLSAPFMTMSYCSIISNALEELIPIYGKVKTIVLPSASGLEHKIGLPALVRVFKDAEIWLCPGQWSFPIDLPLDFL